jgi:hypothetical protein
LHTHVVLVAPRVAEETVNGDDSALDLGLIRALALGVERCIVDEGQVGVAAFGVGNLPESDL